MIIAPDVAPERSDVRYLKTSQGGDAQARMDVETQTAQYERPCRKIE